MEEGAIDFVLPWVDGDDPEWRRECVEYASREATTDPDAGRNSGEQRYRDWGLLRYWFRGVERFAPWVNRIHFVTSDHLPSWLAADHPKLRIVRHRDFIPTDYLPTFSSRCIDLNLHRIGGLSERFVYFNDDTFLLRPVRPSDFFRRGLPCDAAVMSPICLERTGARAEINDMYVINGRFHKGAVIRRDFPKWFSPRYGRFLVRNFLLLPFRTFPGFHISHNPSSFLKDTFEEVWGEAGCVLDETCRHRFRHVGGVNQWLMSYWQIASGRFFPRSPGVGAFYDGVAGYEPARQAVAARRTKFLCWNDGADLGDCFGEMKTGMQEAFGRILPDRSSFERES